MHCPQILSQILMLAALGDAAADANPVVEPKMEAVTPYQAAELPLGGPRPMLSHDVVYPELPAETDALPQPPAAEEQIDAPDATVEPASLEVIPTEIRSESGFEDHLEVVYRALMSSDAPPLLIDDVSYPELPAPAPVSPDYEATPEVHYPSVADPEVETSESMPADQPHEESVEPAPPVAAPHYPEVARPARHAKQQHRPRRSPRGQTPAQRLRRAGCPQCIAPWADLTYDEKYCGYYVGGGAPFYGKPNHIRGEPRYPHEGTWGVDYNPWYSRVRLQWFHGTRKQDGEGHYEPDEHNNPLVPLFFR